MDVLAEKDAAEDVAAAKDDLVLEAKGDLALDILVPVAKSDLALDDLDLAAKDDLISDAPAARKDGLVLDVLVVVDDLVGDVLARDALGKGAVEGPAMGNSK